MSRLMEALLEDEELNRMRTEWIKRGLRPFPGFNTDEYAGIDDYKKKIKEELEASLK